MAWGSPPYAIGACQYLEAYPHTLLEGRRLRGASGRRPERPRGPVRVVHRLAPH